MTKHTYNEKELLLRIVEGDETAFRVIYERYWNRVYSTALAFTQSGQIAMDVVQDTFALLWQKRADLHRVENIEAYIYVSGRNRIASLMRRQRIHVSADLLNSQPLDGGQLSSERQIALQEFRQRIRKAINLLPPKQKEVFILSRIEELSYEEIAEKLNISKDTVRNHLIKALSFMRNYFDERNDDLLTLLICFPIFSNFFS